MKKTTYMLILCLMIGMIFPSKVIQAASFDNDMRAVWISTVFNLDYPSTKNNITAQQEEFIQKLDALQSMGINTVIVQVRPKADALYQSYINPWSDILTGTQGKNPGYDPMFFMIEEAHKRGMSFHAWLNPYRVTTSGTDVNALSINHPARLNPSWTISYGGKLYYNPELEEVKQHIVSTVKEIAVNYNVDGIHFDDYFYPSGYPLPAGETTDGVTANLRREAINDMVQRVSNTIKSINSTYGKSIKFGISPPGIWKNSTSDLSGSNTSGREAYYSVYADARTWIRNGWVDYIVPQIYWKTGHSKADYETLVSWWSNEVFGTKVKLYIGQGVYSSEVAVEIGKQLTINQNYPEVKGSIYFSLRNLLNNDNGCADQVIDFYKGNIADSPQSGNTLPSTNTNGNTNVNTNVNTAGNAASPLAIGKTAVVTATTLNIRNGGRADREVIAKLPTGSKVTIIDVLGEWYKVKLSNNMVGWANAAYLKVNTDETTVTVPNPSQPGSSISGGGTISYPCIGTVNASSLNVRAGARVDREIVAKLTMGTTVTVLSKQGDWYKIKMANQKVGWVNGAYLTLK